MNLRQLETFLWVATLGSFRKTADRLYTTQPAISARIAKLEESLGTKLFERDASSIRLTSKGLELLPYAEKVLRLTEVIRERADEGSHVSGILRLGVSETIVHAWLPEFLRLLHKRYPLIDVDITVDITVNLRTDLIDRSLDIAFLLGPVSEYSISNHELCSFPLTWAVSPAFGINVGPVLSSGEIALHPILTYARYTRPYEEINTHFKDSGEKPARIFPSSSLAACKRMTMDGVGIGTLPIQLISHDLQEGRLIEVPCEWVPSNLNFTVSYPTEPALVQSDSFVTV